MPLPAPHDVELFCMLSPEHVEAHATVVELVAPLGGVPLAIALLAHAAQGNDLTNLRAEQRTRRTAALEHGGTEQARRGWAACVDVPFDRRECPTKRLASPECSPGYLEAPPCRGSDAAVLPAASSSGGGTCACAYARAVGLAYSENGRLRMPRCRSRIMSPLHTLQRLQTSRLRLSIYRKLCRELPARRSGGPGGLEAIARLSAEGVGKTWRERSVAAKGLAYWPVAAPWVRRRDRNS